MKTLLLIISLFVFSCNDDDGTEEEKPNPDTKTLKTDTVIIKND